MTLHERVSDPDGDAYEAGQRMERALDKASLDVHPPDGVEWERPFVRHAEHLSVLRGEFTNTGHDSEISDAQIDENRAWLRGQLDTAGISLEEAYAVGRAVAAKGAREMIENLKALDGVSEGVLLAALHTRMAEMWVDGALVTATYLKR